MDVWLVRTNDVRHDTAALALEELDGRERERADRFVGPGDRLRYIAAHIALRRVLALHTGTAPGELRFTRATCPECGGPHGRPELAAATPPVHFSLSHSHGRVLVAVAAAPVGADIQRSPGGGTVEACLPALHPAERAEVARQSERVRPAAFGRLWTRKEAYLKGIGTGLAHGLSAEYLGTDTRHRPPGWTVFDLDLAEDRAYAAAVAVRAEGVGPPEVRVRSAAFLGAAAPAM
ncbi:4'-phosphopantetheinyl transferase superfamily protein [Streptomyces sp. NBC_00094]|uniref:4'-phosphopantetheinyl transferase family protein n=1 Tax=Streptomyces sp. NBC_00094 TaxID=2903620 RepID=UPI00224CA853|nr:4'-phosphopantetheinyl transferase superfamily protein [Streptomyces sp. NBC_00094]MCX5393906.1 4'-phosphopantetheinyl transferase superfamily protein [Streptomyces sp. NBC_00094]